MVVAKGIPICAWPAQKAAAASLVIHLLHLFDEPVYVVPRHAPPAFWKVLWSKASNHVDLLEQLLSERQRRLDPACAPRRQDEAQRPLSPLGDSAISRIRRESQPGEDEAIVGACIVAIAEWPFRCSLI